MEVRSAELKVSGTTIPLFGYGTWLAEDDECRRGCLDALGAGYRHIDTAQMYKNEKAVGDALKQSGLQRSEVFITSKLMSDKHTPEDVAQTIKESLTKLGVDYLDLFLMHTPNGKNVIATWNAIVQLKKDGLIKAAGVSNFGWKQLQGLKDAGCETPDLNQFELHIFHQQRETVEYCRANGIAIAGHCPLARNKRFNGQTQLRGIAERLGKSEAEVALRWSYQSGFVTIPKSSNPERIKSNLSVVDSFDIPADIMEECKQLDEKFEASMVVKHMDLDWNDVK